MDQAIINYGEEKGIKGSELEKKFTEKSMKSHLILLEKECRLC